MDKVYIVIVGDWKSEPVDVIPYAFTSKEEVQRVVKSLEHLAEIENKQISVIWQPLAITDADTYLDIRRTKIRQYALAKLTPEEREALGVGE
jgi:hypothetical protein